MSIELKRDTQLLSLVIVGFLTLAAMPILAQQPDWDAVEFKSTDLGDGIYMLQGMGGNLGLSVGADGVFLIDDDFAPLTPKLIAAIAEITEKPVDYVINTHWHGDHTGANSTLGESGSVIVAHDNVRTRMAAEGPQQSLAAALPVITFSESTTFHFNGHEIYAFHPSNAHTDGDAIIHFRDLNLIHAGDVLFNGLYPFIDVNSGGSVDGYIAALQRLADLAGPETRIIAGHGPLASRGDVENKIAMLKDAKMKVSALIQAGKTLEEAKAADPLAAYNEDWNWAFIDGARMTELLYGALSQ
jgi:cyclase